ncbi:DUF4407 domain-containing protein [Rhizobium leguminosarum]|nr:DUF4407 domain-containing protein [Rhizobium leguminosarum]
MSGETVASIVVGEKDYTGLPITAVYSKVSNVYAVYCNPERVMVQFADDAELGSKQRLALAHLAPLRGEINGIIDGWRKSQWPWPWSDTSKAKRYDRRTADAMVVALQGDQMSAEALLRAVKVDLVEERTSIGRSSYIIYATICSILIFSVFALLSRGERIDDKTAFGVLTAEDSWWLATGIGCLGAMFSIAIGIRDRTIHTDLRTRDNIVDATLRIIIGAISAVVLLALFKSKIISFAIGENKFDIAAKGPEMVHFAFIVAFLAGFSERLVGDYLGTTVLKGYGNQAGLVPIAPLSTATIANQQKEANEQSPLGRPPQPIDTGVDSGGVSDSDPDRDVDSCLCDVQLKPEEETDDDELPKATGGIEKAA